jgi:hypothetical protein
MPPDQQQEQRSKALKVWRMLRSGDGSTSPA